MVFWLHETCILPLALVFADIKSQILSLSLSASWFCHKARVLVLFPRWSHSLFVVFSKDPADNNQFAPFVTSSLLLAR